MPLNLNSKRHGTKKSKRKMAKIAPDECFPRMYAADLPTFYLISANEGKRSHQKTGS
jgi:hypothetical protein